MADAPVIDAPQEALNAAQSHLDSARLHTVTAEKTYPDIGKTYERLIGAETQAPQGGPLMRAMGEHADQIAHDVNDKHLFDAGERFAQARTALKSAGLGNIANAMSKKNKDVFAIKETRDAMAHPEKTDLVGLSPEQFPDAAKRSIPAIDKAIADTHAADVPAASQAAKEAAIGHLEQMKGHLEPLKDGLIKAAELKPADLKIAVEMQEIHAGNHVAAVKGALKKAGHGFDSHTFPGWPQPTDIVPGTVPGKHPLDHLEIRRAGLAHNLPADPAHPGALDRVAAGHPLAPQLPKHAADIGHPPAGAAVTHSASSIAHAGEETAADAAKGVRAAGEVGEAFAKVGGRVLRDLPIVGAVVAGGLAAETINEARKAHAHHALSDAQFAAVTAAQGVVTGTSLAGIEVAEPAAEGARASLKAMKVPEQFQVSTLRTSVTDLGVALDHKFDPHHKIGQMADHIGEAAHQATAQMTQAQAQLSSGLDTAKQQAMAAIAGLSSQIRHQDEPVHHEPLIAGHVPSAQKAAAQHLAAR